MRLLLPALVALVVLVSSAPAQAAATCSPHPRHHTVQTIASNSLVRVYKIVDPDHAEGFEDTGRVYACQRGTGWRKRLGLDGAYPDLFEVRVVLKGSLLAYSVGCTGCRDNYRFPGRVSVLDVSAHEHDFVYRHREGSNGFATDLALKSNGGVAWISAEETADGRLDYVVRRNDDEGFAELETGRDIDPESLTLGPNSVMRWTRGGQPRSAPIH